MKTYTLQKHRAFTLIELLVVIAIIGVLSSVVLASLNSAREKARDARRIADIRQIQTALELFYDDNGAYPVVDGTQQSDGWVHSTNETRWNNFQEKISAYIPNAPRDPLNEGVVQYSYFTFNYPATGECPQQSSSGGGSDYFIIFTSEGSEFDLPVFSVTSEGFNRYCVKP